MTRRGDDFTSMQPDLRLTVRRDGIVRAVRWDASLVTWGPCATLFERCSRAGVTVADAEIVRDPGDGDEPGAPTELVLEFLSRGGNAGITAIADWATLVGYSRLWLPSGVRDLPPSGAATQVETRCTGCRTRLADGSRDFWDWVRGRGYFPMWCAICGADLPQWRPVRVPAVDAELRAERPRLRETGGRPVSDRRAG